MATPTKIHITTIIMINSISVNPHLFLDIFTSNNNLSFSIQIILSPKKGIMPSGPFYHVVVAAA
jgi:preprotein translocase subunit SecY